MNDIIKKSYVDDIVEMVKKINTDKLTDDISDDIKTSIIEEQKVCFWIRLYLKEEDPNINIGDDIEIEWTTSGEKLVTKFITFDKKGIDSKQEDNISNYQQEDNNKVLCLMIDTKSINFNDDIPFIRTLFKTGYHYEYQLVKRDELLFINKRTGVILDYYDCDF